MYGNANAHAPGTIRFTGSLSAELFSREITESVKGAIANNLVSVETEEFPKGFIKASLPGHPWDDTCWSRDCGVFLREAALWGHIDEAVLIAEYLLDHVIQNPEGHHTFPMFFKYGEKSWGYEMDGTAAVAVGMVRLYQRLDDGSAVKGRLREFLLGPGSPAAYISKKLETAPLVAGSGEFGGGWGVEGMWCNAVQNGLLRQALLACAELEDENGNAGRAKALRDGAGALMRNMLEHLVGADGAWIWCVNPETLKKDEEALNHPLTRASASVNGAGACYADAEGLEPVERGWGGAGVMAYTLRKVYEEYPVRRAQVEKYGMCTFVDSTDPQWLPAYASWLSYCDCYAAQTMLLLDRTDLLDRTLNWIAAATYMGGNPSGEFIRQLGRGDAEVDFNGPTSGFWFTERNFSPDFRWEREVGCGKLNLVNVAEPMKLARMMLGVDDRHGDEVTVVPRLPGSWKELEARSWPIYTACGVVRADIAFEKRAGGFRFRLKTEEGQAIPRLSVRFPNGTRKALGEVVDVDIVY